MKRILPGLLLAALIGTGCVLVSGQFLVQVDLGDVSLHVANAGSLLDGCYVDLPSNNTWKNHKSDIKTLEDLAVVGQFHNTGASSVTISLYLLDGNPGPQPVSTITSTGIKVWGPLTVAAGATENVDWNRSAALFAGGKAALLERIKGGGQFTLYATSSAPSFDLDIKNAVFMAVIGAASGP